MGVGCRMVWMGCIGGTPAWKTYQEEKVHVPPHLIGEQGGEGWSKMGEGRGKTGII